jgi:hypothetical protein
MTKNIILGYLRVYCIITSEINKINYIQNNVLSNKF